MSSLPRATTQQPWTTSLTQQGYPNPCYTSTFPSKLDLYLALLDQSCDRLVEVVEEGLASTGDNSDRVIATVAAFYEFVSSEGSDFRLIFESDLTGDDAVQQRLSRVNAEISDAIAEVIAEDTVAATPASKAARSLLGGYSPGKCSLLDLRWNVRDHPRRSQAPGQQSGLARD
jgi:AcrR family transcriptional regulator